MLREEREKKEKIEKERKRIKEEKLQEERKYLGLYNRKHEVEDEFVADINFTEELKSS